MSTLVELLLSCCERVLQADGQLLAELREQGFVCQAQRWDFQLPALHAWLCARADHGVSSYAEFLQQLYASDLNARLAAHEAQVVIADNRGKVSESLYRLQRLP